MRNIGLFKGVNFHLILVAFKDATDSLASTVFLWLKPTTAFYSSIYLLMTLSLHHVGKDLTELIFLVTFPVKDFTAFINQNIPAALWQEVPTNFWLRRVLLFPELTCSIITSQNSEEF